jgi:hypothetical protein
MAWTAPRTWIAGELVTASIGNAHWRDNLLALRASPDQHCDVYNSTTQAITVGAAAALTFDSERTDTNAMHSTSADTSRVTIQTNKGGTYWVHGRAKRTTGAGTVLFSVRKNGATNLDTLDSRTESETMQITALVPSLVATDYLELYVDPISNNQSLGSATAALANRIIVIGPLPAN